LSVNDSGTVFELKILRLKVGTYQNQESSVTVKNRPWYSIRHEACVVVTSAKSLTHKLKTFESVN